MPENSRSMWKSGLGRPELVRREADELLNIDELLDSEGRVSAKADGKHAEVKTTAMVGFMIALPGTIQTPSRKYTAFV